MGALERLHECFGNRVAFFVVYIKEAHPENEWVLTTNRDEGIAVVDPTTEEGRTEVAESCALRYAIRMPILVDHVDNAVARAYGALPDRLYLIAKDGLVAFQGAEGPWGFRPEELEAAIEKELLSTTP